MKASKLNAALPIAALLAAASVPGFAADAAAATPAASPAFPAHYAAPYLQIDSSDAKDMAADMKATGLNYYTLAFASHELLTSTIAQISHSNT